MGSKSKSKSSTSTNQTDSRQFRSFEQGLTGESVGLNAEVKGGQVTATSTDGGAVIRGSKVVDVEGDNYDIGHRLPVRTSGKDNTVNNRISVVDGGAIRAVENVAGFAINAATGGAFNLAEQAGELVSMISENAAETSRNSYRAVESILAEKQSDGDQGNQKTLLYVVGGVGALVALLMLGGKKK